MKISEKAEADFESNEVWIWQNDDVVKKTKLEPRVMRVFQILVEQSPKVVSREFLITEVWNDYGGADDALNQAISHLRKALEDTDKENRLIETVVKKGYRYNGGSLDQIEDKRQIPKITLILFGLILILVLVVGYLLLNAVRLEHGNDIPQPDKIENSDRQNQQEAPAPKAPK